MNDDLTYDDNVARLASAHPGIFAAGIPPFSDLPIGWYGIVDELCETIERELGPEVCARLVIRQIKEKFGTLRFYWSLDAIGDVHLDVVALGGAVQSIVIEAPPSSATDASAVNTAHDRLCELVDAACEASAHVCQRCSALGTVRQLPWIQTLCDEHFSEALARNTSNVAQRNE